MTVERYNTARPWDFHAATRKALDNNELQTALMRATAKFDDGRKELMAELPESDRVRDMARQIKDEALASLDKHVEAFADNVESAGGHVHFAATAEQANEIIVELAQSRDVKHIVKSKSMVSEETKLNNALESAGLHVVETDFGEFILQVTQDHPSHIVVPVVHRTKEQIAELLNQAFGRDLPPDPEVLAKEARRLLRKEFERADMGITGANFAAADTGTIVQVTNEGNGRLTSTSPRIHVVLMGIEKIIPRFADLPVFLKLLARSATGQQTTVYTNMVTGPRKDGEGDGPEELHVVLVDNGRTRVLGSPYREILRCIRCGACLNTCPVYQTVGGHTYGGVYPGPVGSVLTPLYDGMSRYRDLPHASSLCGACLEACPVRINLPQMLLELKSEQRETRLIPFTERLAFRFWSLGMRSAFLFRLGTKMMRWGLLPTSREGWTECSLPPLGAWTGKRPFPVPAARSFRNQWKKLRRNSGVEQQEG